MPDTNAVTTEENPDENNIVPGPQGDSIMLWLIAAMAYFGPELAAIVRAALARHLETNRSVLGESWIFNDAERSDLTELFSSIGAPSEMVGRVRLHGQAGTVPPKEFEKAVENLRPMRPERAIRYFSELRPVLGPAPKLAAGMRREAFQVAVSTEIQLTRAIQREITGEIASGVPSYKTVERMMRTYGAEPKHRQYADMVARTNVIDAMNQGQWDELKKPGMLQLFPVWKYHAIRDERSRPWHAVRDGRYWSIDVPFSEVRGHGPRNVCNCRCNWSAIPRRWWQALRAQGENVEADPRFRLAEVAEVADDVLKPRTRFDGNHVDDYPAENATRDERGSDAFARVGSPQG